MTRRARGFTLIESMVAVSIAAVLASLGYPSFADQLRKARRVDALVRLMQVQQAQERWRANNSSYASLASLNLASQPVDAIYRLSMLDARADGYVVQAEAQGAQARDTQCRFLQVAVTGGNTLLASGPEASVVNAGSANDRCWLR